MTYRPCLATNAYARPLAAWIDAAMLIRKDSIVEVVEAAAPEFHVVAAATPSVCLAAQGRHRPTQVCEWLCPKLWSSARFRRAKTFDRRDPDVRNQSEAKVRRPKPRVSNVAEAVIDVAELVVSPRPAAVARPPRTHCGQGDVALEDQARPQGWRAQDKAALVSGHRARPGFRRARRRPC